MDTVSILEHVESLLDGMDKRIQQRFEATEKAIEKAEVAFNLRLIPLNELRADVVKKGDFAAVEQRIADLAGRLDRADGRAKGIGDGWGWLIGAVAVVLTALIYFKH